MSKPMGILFGSLTLVAIMAIAPNAFAATQEVDMTPGAGSNQDCVAAKNCFSPSTLHIAVGDTVKWENKDKVGHTTTSGQPSDNQTGTVWDSSLVAAGKSYSFTFKNAGTYQYFCQVHPWMTGEIVVGGASAQTGGSMTNMPGILKGTNMDLVIVPTNFNPATDSNVTLKFVPNPSVPTLVTENVVKHLDYNIVITKSGNEIFNQKFHSHNGNLTLVFMPSSGQISVTGGESNAAHTTTGPFYIRGPVFDSTGNYDISVQVVGVNFIPITPLEDKFTFQAVPEFGSIVPIVLAIAVISGIVLTTKIRVLKL